MSAPQPPTSIEALLRPRPKLHVLAGIPGCGKSTFAAQLPGHVVSTDQLREELAGDASSQDLNDLVFRVFHNTLRWGLSEGEDMIADSTALTSGARSQLRDVAAFTDSEIHLYLFQNPTEALSRNLRRERVVPQDVMVRMVEKYERTLLLLVQESYDSVTRIASYS